MQINQDILKGQNQMKKQMDQIQNYIKDKGYQLVDSIQKNKDKLTCTFLKQRKQFRLKGVFIQQQKYREQFLKILKTIQKNPHQNVAQIYEVTQKDDIIIYSHEQYRYTLQNLEEFKNEPNFNMKQIAIDILNGIIFLHSLGISHLNLKPSNILIDYKGNKFQAKIADLYYEAKQECDEDQIYQGPEQLKNMNTRNVSFQSDYYSVGALLCEILGFDYKKNRENIQQGYIPIIEDTTDDSLQLSFSLDMMQYSQTRRFTPAQTLETFQNDNQPKQQNENCKLILAISLLILPILIVVLFSNIIINSIKLQLRQQKLRILNFSFIFRNKYVKEIMKV
ncbi:kinase domain protein (macronuclear) [Tetrahymena thermophila SB210]|uniref:Kinase domain protein n=1 Tax=Tetrahymena thermophila (strain SB210) TaxID=312017 RepID=Q24CJ8_TETTS|nr:kinase domain protein [Tetrahymena thermophila SB210]EAS05462.2 kinase domain protein [Tetrahymena thermophila SB210]|eukprot:XP_001025707.2 kinase domain protein [Tetrahymena thermophila SB210]